MSRAETTEEALPSSVAFTLTPSEQRRLNAACERIDAFGHGGARPKIEDELPQASEAGRCTWLRRLIECELKARRRRGEEPGLDSYLARFPDDPAAVREAFEVTRVDDPFATGNKESTEGDPSLAPPAAPGPKSTEPDPALSEREEPRPEDVGTETRTVARFEEHTDRDDGAVAPCGTPGWLGRYEIRRQVGEGAFGRVYRAWDDQLKRDVALKVPRAGVLATERHVELFLREARMAASLNHPHIVTVHDVGRADDGTLFVVMEFVEGRSLGELLNAERLGPRRLAAVMAQVAETLHYAHSRGLVHRDVKPSNLLMDTQGEAHIADFGLAVREKGVEGVSQEVAGTPPYMAPEQVRGESHRFDGRTDVWAVGVVLYQMLTGRLPFRGTRPAMFDAILHREPRAPRHIDRGVPRELERICLRCLSKRMTDRYPNALALAVDLRFWLDDKEPPPSSNGSGLFLTREGGHAPSAPRVIFKGLRSFELSDAGFFPALLPGPIDRDGLPQAVRFWKSRFEAFDPDEGFTVGLLYGPSGSGKSSFVKAGLLPALSPRVRSVYFEATPDGTEARLLRGLRRACPDLPDGLALTEAMATVREGPALRAGRKLVIVIDQFEQWLLAFHAGRGEELVSALRQCDGRALQCLLMVRDDFGMAAMRFMNALEVPVVEGVNYATLDRFDARHAAEVLMMYGRALGRLPEAGPLSAEQKRFIASAVDGITEDGKVAPVRLSLLAEIFRDKPWSTAALRRIGGPEGIGVAFLEESLGSSASDPRRRAHAEAARAVLKELLPGPTVDIKGHMRPYRELLAASRYAARPEAFEELISLLEGELRLITPCDPLKGGDDTNASGEWSTLDALSGRQPVGRYFQLTHDYLVPSLRKWLTRKQSETQRGRAELLLEDRAGVWNARPERRYLPSLLEWLRIMTLTRPTDRTPPQARMIHAATRLHAGRLVLAGAAATFALGLGLAGFESFERARRSGWIDGRVSLLLKGEMDHVLPVIAELDPYRAEWRPAVAAVAADPSRDPSERSRAHLALVRDDPSSLAPLVERLTAADPSEHRVIRAAVARWPREFARALWLALERPDPSGSKHLRAAAALAGLAPAEDARWDGVARSVVRGLVADGPARANEWAEALAPISRKLIRPLEQVFRDPQQLPPERVTAAEALASFADDDPSRLDDLAVEADPNDLLALMPRLLSVGRRLVPPLQERLAVAAPETRPSKLADARRKANAAIVLIRLGEAAAVWPQLGSSAAPDVRTRLIHGMLPLGVAPGLLAEQLQSAQRSDPLVRQALLLALGESSPGDPSANDSAGLVDSVARLYTDDADPGVHAAAEWLLRRWGHADLVSSLSGRLRGVRRRGWLVDDQGLEMVIVHAPASFVMGTPLDDDGLRDENESVHRRNIRRNYALAMREVTVGEYQGFNPEYQPDPRISRGDGAPATKINWYNAVRYCRYLDEQAGIEPERRYYVGDIREGMPVRVNPEGVGFRLPTEAEWEFAARAGTDTPWFFGDSPEFLPRYSWFVGNAEDNVHPCGSLAPNPWGLFDVYGNVLEWCHDGFGPYPVDDPDADPVGGDSRVSRGGCYRSSARVCRSGKRENYELVDHSSILGFRVARTLTDADGLSLDVGSDNGSRTRGVNK
jgi:serine/threonine protein kinase/formylglycine-generating enzyme required for sulfatase activity